jgi:integrase
MTGTRTLPKGIAQQPDGTYRCEIRIRPLPKVTKRFPPETALREMVAWCEEQRVALRAERKLVVPDDSPIRRRLLGTRGALERGPTTFAADVKYYLKTYLDHVHPSTRQNRERYLNAWVGLFGSRPRQSIQTREIIEGLQLFQHEGIVTGKPLKPETVIQVRLALLRFYESLNSDTELNPVKRVPLAKVPRPEPRGVTYEIVEKILDHLPTGTATAARCRLMAYTGMRPCEIMRIRPREDWDRAQSTLLIRTAKGGVSARMRLGSHATRALEELDRLHAWGNYWAAPVSRAFHEARVAAGYAELPLVPYDLRHCYGTLIYAQTQDLKAVKEALRHSTLRLSERYMAAAVSPMMEKVHDQTEAYFTRHHPLPPPLKLLPKP